MRDCPLLLEYDDYAWYEVGRTAGIIDQIVADIFCPWSKINMFCSDMLSVTTSLFLLFLIVFIRSYILYADCTPAHMRLYGSSKEAVSTTHQT